MSWVTEASAVYFVVELRLHGPLYIATVCKARFPDTEFSWEKCKIYNKYSTSIDQYHSSEGKSELCGLRFRLSGGFELRECATLQTHATEYSSFLAD